MLNKYLIKHGILLEPAIQKKWHVLEYLTRFFCHDFQENVIDKIFETILNREIIVSTGLGGGVAIPHARTNLVDKTGLLFARFKDGIEWDSIDGSKVYFLFLIIGPVASAEEYLFVLSKISKMLSRNPNRDLLMKAKSTEDVEHVFSEVRDREHHRIQTVL